MFTLEKLYRNWLRCKYRFVMYHIEERSVSNAIQYKKCAQLFVVNVNKSPIQHIFREATKSYTVWYEHGLSLCLRTRFQVPSVTLTSFMQGKGNFSSLPQNKPLKSPPRLGLEKLIICYIWSSLFMKLLTFSQVKSNKRSVAEHFQFWQLYHSSKKWNPLREC